MSGGTISSSPMVVHTVLCGFGPIETRSQGEQEGWLSLFWNSHTAFQSLTLIKRREILPIFCLDFQGWMPLILCGHAGVGKGTMSRVSPV